MNRRKRIWMSGAAALGAGLLVAGPLTAAAQEDDDWVTEALSGLVSDGTLTQQQADAVGQALDAAKPTGEHGPGGRHGRGGPGSLFGRPLGGRIGLIGLDEAATALGLEPDALRDALRDGQTIAEVAADNNVEVQTVIDAMVAAADARLDEAVADGRIDADAAAERLTEATERITTIVTEGFPARDERHPGGDDEPEPETETPATTTPNATSPPTTTD